MHLTPNSPRDSKIDFMGLVVKESSPEILTLVPAGVSAENEIANLAVVPEPLAKIWMFLLVEVVVLVPATTPSVPWNCFDFVMLTPRARKTLIVAAISSASLYPQAVRVDLPYANEETNRARCR